MNDEVLEGIQTEQDFLSLMGEEVPQDEADFIRLMDAPREEPAKPTIWDTLRKSWKQLRADQTRSVAASQAGIGVGGDLRKSGFSGAVEYVRPEAMQETAEKSAKLQAEANMVDVHPGVRRIMEAGANAGHGVFNEAGMVVAQSLGLNPVQGGDVGAEIDKAVATVRAAATGGPEAIAHLVGGSLFQSVPAVLMGSAGALAGPPGVAIGTFLGSLSVEEQAAVGSYLMEAGVDITDPEQLAKALSDAALMEEVNDRAFRRGVGVAAVEGLTSLIAGKMVGGIPGVKGKIAALGAESFGEGAGEVGGQVASGEGVDLAEATVETIAGAGQSVGGVATQVLANRKSDDTGDTGAEQVRGDDPVSGGDAAGGAEAAEADTGPVAVRPEADAGDAGDVTGASATVDADDNAGDVGAGLRPDDYPSAGDTVDGRTVRPKVDNTGSISATFDDDEYTVLDGVREVRMDFFDSSPYDLFSAKNDLDRARSLADEIGESGEISPLIVVFDDDGPYILEGAHRLAALNILGAESFPALVVDARENRGDDADQGLGERPGDEGTVGGQDDAAADAGDRAVGEAGRGTGSADVVADVGQDEGAVSDAQLEPESAKEPEKTIGLKKAEIDRTLTEAGRDGLSEVERRKWGTALAEAKSDDAETIAKGVLNSPRAVSDTEHAAMVKRAAELSNEYEAKLKEGAELVDAGKDGSRVFAEADGIMDRIEDLMRASDMAGTEAARSLSIRRMMLNRESFKIADVVQRAAKRKGEKLTSAEREQLKDVVSKLEERDKQVSELEAKLEKAEERAAKVRAEQAIRKPRKGKARKRADILAELAKKGIGIQGDISTTDQLPDSAKAQMMRDGVDPSQVMGVAHEGKVYVNPAYAHRADEIVRHELAHVGLRGVFGDKVNDVLDGVASSKNERLQEIAADVRQRYASQIEGLSKQDADRLVAEEVIAKVAETDFQPSRVKAVYLRVKKLLKDLFGLDYSIDDIRAILMRTRGYVGRQEGSQRYMTAYHGTPHKFDRFSTENIGTGEGAQAYGWGLYFASKKEIAEHYKDQLGFVEIKDLSIGSVPIYRNGVPVDYSPRSSADMDIVRASFQEHVLIQEHLFKTEADPVPIMRRLIDDFESVADPDDKATPELMKRLRRSLDNGRYKSNVQRHGSVLEVDLVPKDYEYLLFDKPLTKQSKHVKEALKFAGIWKEFRANASDFSTHGTTRVDSGEGVYAFLEMKMGSAEAASKKLLEIGIRGNKYLDGSSRNEGRGSYNYVIFDEADVEIKQRYSLAPPVESDAFKKWFGDSKVVDADGNPQLQYHWGYFDEDDGVIFDGPVHFGSEDAATERQVVKFFDDLDKSIEIEEDDGGRFHWSTDLGDSYDWGYEDGFDSEEEARSSAMVANREAADNYEPDESSGVTTVAYLSIKNPKRVVDQGDDWDSAITKAKAEGHDGIVYENRFEDAGSDSWIAFNPTQVKSVNNVGTYDPTNPDIRYALADEFESVRGLIRELALSYAGENTTLDEVVSKVQEAVPDVSEQEVWDALSGRGKPSKKQVRSEKQKQVAALKREARLMSQLADAEEGVFDPKRKKPATPKEIKALRKQLNQLRQEFFRSETDDARLNDLVQKLDKLRDDFENNVIREKQEKRADPEAIAKVKQQLRDLRSLMKATETANDLEAQLRGDKPLVIPPKREARIVSKELERARARRDIARKEVRMAIREMERTTARKVASELASLPRALKATADLSYTLRQAAVLSARRPLVASKNFVEALRAAFSEEYAHVIDANIRAHDNQYLRDKSKLYLSPLGGSMDAREESFMSNWANKIPVVGKVVEASERNMITGLNLIRTAAFDQFVASYPDATPEQLAAYAKFINAATGRGSLGSFEQSAKSFSRVFFAPRFAVSRIQTPYLVAKSLKDPVLRKEMGKDYAAFVGVALTFLVLADLGLGDDGEVGLDPFDSDFGKLVVRNTRLDPWAGFQQPLRTLMLAALTPANVQKVLGLDERESDPYDTFSRFAKYKLSPTVGLLMEAATGKNVIGQEVTLTETMANAGIPIIIESTRDALKGGGAGDAALTFFPELLGMGASYRDDELQSVDVKPVLKRADYRPSKASAGEDYDIKTAREADLDFSRRLAESIREADDLDTLTPVELKKRLATYARVARSEARAAVEDGSGQ